MRQYYRPTSLCKQQYVSAYDYGKGEKLMEHAYLRNGFVNAIIEAIKPGGLWHHNRIVWAGDYMDDGLFLEAFEDANVSENLYSYAKYFKRIRPVIHDGPYLRFLVNHTGREYVDLNAVPKSCDLIIHPLPLLTCSGNGRGGWRLQRI